MRFICEAIYLFSMTQIEISECNVGNIYLVVYGCIEHAVCVYKLFFMTQI